MSVGKGDVCEATGKYEITTTMSTEICPMCVKSECKESGGKRIGPVVERCSEGQLSARAF